MPIICQSEAGGSGLRYVRFTRWPRGTLRVDADWAGATTIRLAGSARDGPNPNRARSPLERGYGMRVGGLRQHRCRTSAGRPCDPEKRRPAFAAGYQWECRGTGKTDGAAAAETPQSVDAPGRTPTSRLVVRGTAPADWHRWRTVPEIWAAWLRRTSRQPRNLISTTLYDPR